MANAYVVNADGSTSSMRSIKCADEDKELQLLLERNFQLLPGDQIEPDDPCRWMLIKREMDVPDTASGANRWLIDFFFVDQNAIPTFVECKRYRDTRARREVVAQMLEYVANAQHLWTKQQLRDYAEETARSTGNSTEEFLRKLQVESPEAVDDFFAKVEENLRSTAIRIIFFLEKAPEELKRLVEFLYEEMKTVDVLLVEARLYESDGVRFVVPQLFGFTERARLVKEAAKPATAQQSGTEWNWARLRADAEQRGIDAAGVNAMQRVIESCQQIGFTCKWGRGKQLGGMNVVCPVASPSLFLSVYSDGRLWFNLGNLNASPEATSFRDALKDAIVTRLGFKVREDYQNRYPNYAVEDWAGKVDEIVAVLKEFAPKSAVATA